MEYHFKQANQKKKKPKKLMVAHSCHPSTWEAEISRSSNQGQKVYNETNLKIKQNTFERQRQEAT